MATEQVCGCHSCDSCAFYIHIHQRAIDRPNSNVYPFSNETILESQKRFVNLSDFGKEIIKMKIAPLKPIVTYDTFAKIDFRIGTINRVEDIQGADKLVKLIVDFGDHKRTILAGIKQERKDPKALEDKQAIFVVNLAPRKMMGEISEGMLFDIGYADGLTPVLAIPEKPVPAGTQAG